MAASLPAASPPNRDTYTIEADCDLPRVTAISLELIPDDSTPGKGIGRSPHSNIVVTSLRIANLPEGSAPQPLAISLALADFEQSAPRAP